jgi:ferredoxin
VENKHDACDTVLGTISAAELGFIAIHQYLGAGVDTTVASIGNVVALFGRYPEQLEVDALRCEGHGLYLQAAPQVLLHDKNAEVVIDVEGLTTGEALPQAEAAVRICPVAALRLTQAP